MRVGRGCLNKLLSLGSLKKIINLTASSYFWAQMETTKIAVANRLSRSTTKVSRTTVIVDTILKIINGGHILL